MSQRFRSLWRPAPGVWIRQAFLELANCCKASIVIQMPKNVGGEILSNLQPSVQHKLYTVPTKCIQYPGPHIILRSELYLGFYPNLLSRCCTWATHTATHRTITARYGSYKVQPHTYSALNALQQTPTSCIGTRIFCISYLSLQGVLPRPYSHQAGQVLPSFLNGRGGEGRRYLVCHLKGKNSKKPPNILYRT